MGTKQVVLITGATAGIGKHAALHLAAQGHHVIATGRNPRALAALREGAKGRLDTVVLDVTDAASIAAAAHEVERLTDGHGVDALVNNAGYGLAAPLEEVTDADLRAQFETNVFGLMAVTRAFVPAMRRRGAGRIVNVSSMAGRVTFPLMGAYHASKYAVEALSDALRMELHAAGIRVSLVEPGPVRTEFAERSVATVNRYRSPSSPYARIYEKADMIKAQSDKQAVGPERVTAAIERAITARRPKARYVVTLQVKLAIAFFRLLPTRVSDWLIRSVIGLTPKALAAPPTQGKLPAAQA